MKIKIGDKLVEAKATAEEIHRPDSRVDVVIKVPCLQIASDIKKG